MIFLGATRAEVLESCPRDLWCYEDAYKLKRKERDEFCYLQGVYNYEAVAIAVGNAFRDKGKKATPYLDRPLLSEHTKSEEDLQKQRELFVARLMAMQTNFELEHPKNGAD